jgi:hypothetical protein
MWIGAGIPMKTLSSCSITGSWEQSACLGLSAALRKPFTPGQKRSAYLIALHGQSSKTSRSSSCTESLTSARLHDRSRAEQSVLFMRAHGVSDFLKSEVTGEN